MSGCQRLWPVSFCSVKGLVAVSYTHLDVYKRQLLLWGSNGVVGAQTDPLEAWRPWLPRITGRAVPTGHFMVEERPDEVLAEIQEHLAAAARD